MEFYDLSSYSTWSSSWLLFSWIFWLALFVWAVVCMWIIFKKAGRKWRESLIPIRNARVLFKIAGKTPRFWAFVVLPVLSFVLSIAQAFLPSTISAILGRILWLWAIVCLIATITVRFWLAKNFWKSGWFGLGLLLLSPIFLWILAFDDSKYSA